MSPWGSWIFLLKKTSYILYIYVFELLGAKLSQHSHFETPILRCLLQSHENPRLVETWQMFFWLEANFLLKEFTIKCLRVFFPTSSIFFF